MLWLRWWDTEGNLLLTGTQRASRTQQTLLDAIPRLLGMGLNAEEVAEALVKLDRTITV
ncbi:hypothetical protein [Microcoleus sp. LAD1_D3]|uniref:hypothetical protein n=1 Tax=Microcoleus sp. LAD1_D3 TaxID=2819365 RepID=UPI002FD3E653